MGILLLQVGRLSAEDAQALGAIMACYDARLVLLRKGVLCLHIDASLADDFLAHVSRDVLPVEVLPSVATREAA